MIFFFFVSVLPLPESVIWGLHLSNPYKVLKGTAVLSEAPGELVPQHWACALSWVHPSLSTAQEWTQTCSLALIAPSWEFPFLEFRPMLPLCYWGTQEAVISCCVTFFILPSCLFVSRLGRLSEQVSGNNVSLSSYYMCLICFSF